MFEKQFIQIFNETSEINFIIGYIYRPPRTKKWKVEFFFKGCLLEFFNKNKEIIIAGDYNLNLLDIYKRPCVDGFFNNVLSAEFIPLINLPTRFSKKSASLIDNFFFKASKADNS